jgi:ABC-type uncharacterized transport system substrate-binding protein
MRRRQFVGLLGGGLIVWPFAAEAQTASVPVIGFLHPTSARAFERPVAAFHDGLNEIGYFEGRNVKIEYRWAEGHEDRLKTLAADLVQRQVSLITAAGGSFVALAAKAATATIPVLFIAGSDPVGSGLVSALNRPGGNATGVSLVSTEMLAKRLEMLRELVPTAGKVAMLGSSALTVEKFEADFAEKNGLIVLKLGEKDFDAAELESQFDAAVKNGAQALLVSADPFFTNRRDLIVSLATKHALPGVYPWRQYTLGGGLASYGPSITEAYREIGRYAGRILKGAKPADLPVQVPTKFEFVLNLGTAKALGLSVSPWMIARADEVIE